MKLVLAGTPEISIKAFKNIIENFDVLAIVTQPDKPKGRGMKMESTPVAKLAEKHGIKLFKPANIKDVAQEIIDLNFDMFLTFAFGQWIPNDILNAGKYKPTNIHGSLLPKYRGAAPIHYAILNGDEEIGITFMEMAQKMDSGDIYFKASRKIEEKTTTGDGFKIVSELAADNIMQWLRKVEAGNFTPIPQGDNYSLSPKIEKSFGELKKELTIHEATRKIRGLNPFPGAFIFIDNKRLKVFDVSKKYIPNSIEIILKDGLIYAIDYQWEGKSRKKLNT